MSLLSSSVSPNVMTSYVKPGTITVLPDGGYSVEKASYYSQQQSLPPLMAGDNYMASPVFVDPSSFQMPQDSKGKRALKAAFNPRDLAVDTGIGAIAAVLWTGADKFLGYSRPFSRNLILIPMMIAFGALVRGFVNSTGGYSRR